MNIAVDGKLLRVPDNSNVMKVLSVLKINPETVLVARNGEILLESDMIRLGDKLKLVKVVSGG